MTGPSPYILLPGTAREALSFYAEVFDGRAELHTLADFARTDGPPGAIAHGQLTDTPVALYIADATTEDTAFHARGLMLSLLGTADATTLRRWFTRLSHGGTVVEDLQQRAWGAFDGQVIDRYGLHWLIGYEPDTDS